MISALQSLQAGAGKSELPEQMAAFGIHGSKGGLAALFSSHPPLDKRIGALQAAHNLK
jgi:heat shock protein HtpX